MSMLILLFHLHRVGGGGGDEISKDSEDRGSVYLRYVSNTTYMHTMQRPQSRINTSNEQLKILT
jgi:hypothetical protein